MDTVACAVAAVCLDRAAYSTCVGSLVERLRPEECGQAGAYHCHNLSTETSICHRYREAAIRQIGQAHSRVKEIFNLGNLI